MPLSNPESEFFATYGEAPTLVARAPGRVNLIGDHTDYNDLPVLPVALRERVTLHVRPRADTRVRVLSGFMPDWPEDFRLDEALPPRDTGDWRNYVRAAASGVVEMLPASPVGFDAYLSSDLPPASGLSSSSAVVVATTITLLAVNGIDVDPIATAVRAARAERYVGTAGGGMDQAASLCGREGHALKIDFAPLRVTPVPVPATWRFICAFSGHGAEKSGAVQQAYNARVESCGRGLDRVGAVIGTDRALSFPALMANVPLVELLSLAERCMEDEDLRRFRHTVTEADRVEKAVEAMREADGQSFGRLMTASHRSLATDYEVSTPVLDELVHAAMDAGAWGARLTGAGFGGSIVALTDDAGQDALMRGLGAVLDAAVGTPPTPDPRGRGGSRVFAIVPSGGAGVERIR